MPDTTPASFGYDRRYYMFQREHSGEVKPTPPAFGFRGWFYDLFKQEETFTHEA